MLNALLSHFPPPPCHIFLLLLPLNLNGLKGVEVLDRTTVEFVQGINLSFVELVYSLLPLKQGHAWEGECLGVAHASDTDTCCKCSITKLFFSAWVQLGRSLNTKPTLLHG